LETELTIGFMCFIIVLLFRFRCFIFVHYL